MLFGSIFGPNMDSVDNFPHGFLGYILPGFLVIHFLCIYVGDFLLLKNLADLKKWRPFKTLYIFHCVSV